MAIHGLGLPPRAVEVAGTAMSHLLYEAPMVEVLETTTRELHLDVAIMEETLA